MGKVEAAEEGSVSATMNCIMQPQAASWWRRFDWKWVIRLLVFVVVLGNLSSFAADSCVIVKRHVHKFGENASRFHPHRPFDYVEGRYPPGFKFRSELGDGDVRDLQKKGGRIVVLRPDYQLSDLEDARKQCGQQSQDQ